MPVKESEDKCHILYKALMEDDEQKVFEVLGNEINNQRLEELRMHTVNNDTLMHIAIYGKLQEENVIKILDKLTPDADYIIKEPNKLGDTVLHEVAGTNMLRLAKKLIEKDQELLLMRNQFGEIPLFKAVQLGDHDTFCCLADEMKKRYPNEMHNKSLFSRKSKFGDNQNIGDTILHQAILNESFGIALKIIKWFPELVNQRNEYNLIGLQLLSGMTSAFKSGRNYGLLERLIYYCLPNQADKEVADDANDELGNQKEKTKDSSHKQWSFLSFGIPIVKRIKQEKRKHQYAFKLAKDLIEKDLSWNEDDKSNRLAYEFQPIVKEDDCQSDENESAIEKEEKGKIFDFPPLLIATSRGVVEIVDEILRLYPQAVDVVSSIQQNILHIAIKHRQLAIFNKVVDNNKFFKQRLVRRIDKNGNSLLCHLGNLTYSKASELAPAFQLQEELHWFERVEKITPVQYKMYPNKYCTHKNTPWEYFESNHKKMLETAQEWVKRTSESCSTVAVLIATVAFAAAYTVPGGSDDKGSPILIRQLFFTIFTITDVLALASSLTAVVMFLSILTSPFDILDFKSSLPNKLRLGFNFLFLSVAMTMLSFAATIILIVQLKKRWFTIVVYTIAFLPVSMLALLQLPFFLMFENIWEKVQKIKKRLKILP